MGTFLFNSTIFGPVISRRLGSSLGINLLPNDIKICNFNCIYCECGLTPGLSARHQQLPSRALVRRLLKDYLAGLKHSHEKIDTLTFAGNGEPTLHPEFPGIIDDVLELRKTYLPVVKIAVLSNGTFIHHPEVFKALHKVDYNILKLDSMIDETQKLINCPLGDYSIKKTMEGYKRFKGKQIIQTMFFRGIYNGKPVDNTSESELKLLFKAYQEINPESIMIYALSRDTPHPHLQKVTEDELKVIAGRIEKLGIKTHVSG